MRYTHSFLSYLFSIESHGWTSIFILPYVSVNTPHNHTIEHVLYKRKTPGSVFVVLTVVGPERYLEGVEHCGVGDVGDLVHVFELPVVRLSRGQQSHPAQLVSEPLLQIGNAAGA